jgi:hypothetical protein
MSDGQQRVCWSVLWLQLLRLGLLYRQLALSEQRKVYLAVQTCHQVCCCCCYWKAADPGEHPLLLLLLLLQLQGRCCCLCAASQQTP